MPKLSGKKVKISAFVDANHAGNKVTGRSHSGLIVFVQNVLIIWFSKRQNTVESATFGSEFVALRILKDQSVALHHKLRMFGVPIDGPVDAFCGDAGVMKNASVPESALQKKQNSINHHAVQEGAAAGVPRVGKEDGQMNSADSLMKVQSGPRRKELARGIVMWESVG